MAEKIANLSANDGQPTVEISISRTNGFLRGMYRILLYDRNDTHPTLVGTNGDDVANTNGSFIINTPVAQLNDCWLRYRVFVGGDNEVVGQWFLNIKILQNDQIVDGGNIKYQSNFDSLDFIGDKVRLKIQ